MESDHTQRSSLNILLSTFRLPSFITTERWMCGCIQYRYLDTCTYYLYLQMIERMTRNTRQMEIVTNRTRNADMRHAPHSYIKQKL